MSRYIDVSNLDIPSDENDYDELVAFADKVAEMITDAPTIEPKRGKWIDMGDFEQCSVCKGTRLKEFQSYYGKTTWIKTPYCPNCGARMFAKDTNVPNTNGADDADA